MSWCVVQGDMLMNWKFSEVPSRLHIVSVIVNYIKMKINIKRKIKVQASIYAVSLDFNWFLTFRYHVDFGEYLGLEWIWYLSCHLKWVFDTLQNKKL